MAPDPCCQRSSRGRIERTATGMPASLFRIVCLFLPAATRGGGPTVCARTDYQQLRFVESSIARGWEGKRAVVGNGEWESDGCVCRVRVGDRWLFALAAYRVARCARECDRGNQEQRDVLPTARVRNDCLDGPCVTAAIPRWLPTAATVGKQYPLAIAERGGSGGGRRCPRQTTFLPPLPGPYDATGQPPP